MRWIVVLFQAVVLACAAFAAFVFSERYPEYVLNGPLVNQLGFVFAICLLLATVRSVVWADVKATAAIGTGLFVLSLITRGLWDRVSFGSLVMLQSPDLEGLSIAFSYAFLVFALLYCGVLLVKRVKN